MHQLRPTFLIIGAQKAGTTALFDYLGKHPKILPSTVKEIDFFSCESRFAKGLDFYHSHFLALEGASDGVITFEASPHYLASPVASKRISEYSPDIKLIALLRDPVERAFSAWNMYKKFYNDNADWFAMWMRRADESYYEHPYVKRDLTKFDSFEYAIEEELRVIDGSKNVWDGGNGRKIESPLLLPGRYSEQLEKYFEVFKREQLLIFDTKKFTLQTHEVLAEITEYLGVVNHSWENENLERVFVGDYSEEISWKAKEILENYYKPHNEKLFSLLNQSYGW